MEQTQESMGVSCHFTVRGQCGIALGQNLAKTAFTLIQMHQRKTAFTLIQMHQRKMCAIARNQP
jgi:hypothetical protein